MSEALGDGGAADALFGSGGGTSAGGGAADAAAGAGADGGAADAGAAASGAGAGSAAADKLWYRDWGLSDASEGDRPGDLGWLANKGYKDPATLVKSMRALESRVGGAIMPPKDGDPPEKVEAYYKAIGRPETAEGYEIKLPDGAKLDERLFGSFRETAFKAGLPGPMAAELGAWFVQQQLDQNAALVAARNQEAEATLKEWGPNKDANLALAGRAAAKLGITREDIANIQMGYGAGKTLDLLRQLGGGMAEDVMIDGGNRQRFGVTGAEAQVELDRMEGDPDTVKKIMAKDPITTQRRERLLEAIAAAEDEKRRGAA